MIIDGIPLRHWIGLKVIPLRVRVAFYALRGHAVLYRVDLTGDGGEIKVNSRGPMLVAEGVWRDLRVVFGDDSISFQQRSFSPMGLIDDDGNQIDG